MSDRSLNHRAFRLVEELVADATDLKIDARVTADGAWLIDLGIAATGGLEAGRRLAEICLSGLASVQFVPAGETQLSTLAVQVVTDHPWQACMASQYAGWQITHGKYFAMGSGPFRAAANKESLFADLDYREQPDRAVGVLETRKFPEVELHRQLAADCDVPPGKLALLVAPTASQAGNVQVVARSVETALHKLHSLEFDVRRVQSAAGRAPLPPVASDDLVGIGRTNDAILYGAEVTLWLRADDAQLESLVAQIPSSASSDFGRSFLEIFESYGRDFYRIDSSLFSPAVIRLVNLDSGRVWQAGKVMSDILAQSFGPA